MCVVVNIVIFFYHAACHVLPSYVSVLVVVVLKIMSPAGGLVMASRCVVVILGSSTPCVVLENSTIAFELGADVVPNAVEPTKLFVVLEPD